MQNSYIKLVEKSKQPTITIEDVENLLTYYNEITEKTGEQLNFPYREFAWPYDVIKKENEEGKILICIGNQQKYQMIAIGIEAKNDSRVQITLNENATEGDKAKANELAKFLAKKLDAELHLFNGRIMYFHKR